MAQCRLRVERRYAYPWRRRRKWAALFTPNGTWRAVESAGGPPLVRVQGTVALVTFAKTEHDRRPHCRHRSGNLLLDGDGKRASGRSYGFVITAVNGLIEWIAHATFEDELAKVDDVWRFASRTLIQFAHLEVPLQTAATHR